MDLFAQLKSKAMCFTIFVGDERLQMYNCVVHHELFKCMIGIYRQFLYNRLFTIIHFSENLWIYIYTTFTMTDRNFTLTSMYNGHSIMKWQSSSKWCLIIFVKYLQVVASWSKMSKSHPVSPSNTILALMWTRMNNTSCYLQYC